MQIRAIHLPTGTVAKCDSGMRVGNFVKTRDTALQMLAGKVATGQPTTAIIRDYDFGTNTVTDARTGETVSGVQRYLDGKRAP